MLDSNSFPSSMTARSQSGLQLFLFGRCIGRRSNTHDLEQTLFVFCAVVMDLFSVMDDEASRRNRFGVFHIVFGTRIDPPRSRQHRDVTVVRMKMGATVVMREPLLKNDV